MPKHLGRPVTLKDIARVTGLSVPAVSLSLFDNPSATVKISPATRQKVRSVAKEMGYRPNRAAQSLSKGSTKTVGIITFHASSIYNQSYISEARSLLATAGLTAFVYHVEKRTDDATLQACHDMIDARADGVILYLPGEQLRPQGFDVLRNFGMPIVSVGGVALAGIPRYVADEMQGFDLLTEHLLDEGYRNIGLVTYEAFPSDSQAIELASSERTRSAAQGYQDAVDRARKRGIKLKSRIHRLDLGAFGSRLPHVPGMDEHYVIGYLAMRRLIELGDLPEALIFQADGKALGAMRACSENGIKVPKDIAIAGFNDDRSCSVGYIPMTSVALPVKEMARLAATELIDCITNKSSPASDPVYLRCRVMVRQSTSKKRTAPVAVDFDLKKIFR